MFLAKSIWTGAAMAAAGCVSGRKGFFGTTVGAPMQGFVAPRLDTVRVGVVGIGGRGYWAMQRLAGIPGVRITALCDIVAEKVDKGLKWLKEHKQYEARRYVGCEEYKRLCCADDVDVVYNVTPWDLHAPIALYAMRAGKHAFVEVPGALSIDECYELVETSEATKRHCMQLENCCYGEIEMLTFHLARLGMFGELVHGEGAYIHDLRGMARKSKGESESWRYGFNRDHKGNMYPTHGLVPLCLTFDINRGDKFEYLVSLESQQANFKALQKAILPQNDPRHSDVVQMGDMNTTLLKTWRGRSIMIQHDVSSPRPYSRIQFVSGTKGAICDYPYRVVFESAPGKGAHAWFDEKQAEDIRKKYMHPLWKTAGAIAAKVGGHGGMDYLMDLRWVYCLRNGMPLDMDVYDLATTSSLCELCERSVRDRSRPMEVPDFTRGAWRTNEPLGLVDVDIARAGIG